MRANTRSSAAAVITGVVLLVAALFAGTAEAKKKKSKSFSGSSKTATAVPNALGTSPFTNGVASSTIRVGKKFKGATVGRVEVTVQTTGSGVDQTNFESASGDLTFLLIGPDGTPQGLFQPTSFFLLIGPGGPQPGPNSPTTGSIGPLTAVPNSKTQICNAPFPSPTPPPPPPPPCSNPNASLNAPYAGIVGDPELWLYKGLGMKGAWTMEVQDNNANTAGGVPLTSSFTWSLKITPEKSTPTKSK